MPLINTTLLFLLLLINSYRKPRVEYFMQSMRADRKNSGYSIEQLSVTRISSTGYQRLKSEGGKVVRNSYRSVQRIRNSRRSSQRQRQRFTAPSAIRDDSDVGPLLTSITEEENDTVQLPTKTKGGYGALSINT